jgi:hypothetical protein
VVKDVKEIEGGFAKPAWRPVKTPAPVRRAGAFISPVFWGNCRRMKRRFVAAAIFGKLATRAAASAAIGRF